jgi:hypothetical protein
MPCEFVQARPPDVSLVQTTLIKQFEHPMHFFDAIEITGWSSRQPRNDAEVFINIGLGGRILSARRYRHYDKNHRKKECVTREH